MAKVIMLKEAAIEAAIRTCGGIHSLIAEKLGCTPQNVGHRIRSSERLQKAVRETEAKILDMCDAGFLKAIQGGDLNTMRWYAERKGKARGYGNKVENSFDEAQLEAIVASLGGDPAKFAAALRALGVDPDQA